ncbi:MAG: hypothetical protein L0Y54_18050, partial [Sporichthyaceae bacterium]|nr:hypothetical protein [Sporichthyaceae bacterium]
MSEQSGTEDTGPTESEYEPTSPPTPTMYNEAIAPRNNHAESEQTGSSAEAEEPPADAPAAKGPAAEG